MLTRQWKLINLNQCPALVVEKVVWGRVLWEPVLASLSVNLLQLYKMTSFLMVHSPSRKYWVIIECVGIDQTDASPVPFATISEATCTLVDESSLHVHSCRPRGQLSPHPRASCGCWKNSWPLAAPNLAETLSYRRTGAPG